MAAGLISAMTAPGQTAGLSVFTDPLIRTLGVDRTVLSGSYLVGTLVGALAQPLIGRAADRWDIRHVVAGIGAFFVVMLLGLSFVNDVLGLTVGYVGVRMAGQGALGLAVTTAISRGIRHRRGLALGVSAAIGTAGISLAPILIEPVINAGGIRTAWRWEALAVALVVIPLAYLMPRAELGSRALGGPSHVRQGTWDLKAAVRTGMFWVLCAATATTAMLGTALNFHQIAVLGERGLTPFQAAANFLPQMVTGLLTTLAVGALIDRLDPRGFIVASMVMMAAALVMVSVVAPGWRAVAYGLVLGAAGGALRGMEAASFVRYFGSGNIGSIRGLSSSIGLAASALGPFALAVSARWAGSFSGPSAVMAVIPIAVAVAALVVRPPSRPGPRRPKASPVVDQLPT